MDSEFTNSTQWEWVIGLEIHAQLSSNSKLFSAAANSFGGAPNTQVSLIDAAMPGMLPVLNQYCVHQAIKTGLALNAHINTHSHFDRKNYFYPDLPQGYQISQFYRPIVQNGYINITLKDGSLKTVRINRLHLEQDAGKSIHDQSALYSFIDLNRAGIGLMEIVTDPDISSAAEAAEVVKKIRTILRYIGSCDGDMEKGSLRCDANVSVRKTGEALGTRCEIKNLNSTSNIIKAIEFEAARQIQLLKQGEIIRQETRLFDAVTGHTRTMRLKEESVDYRYFPDPDLLPLIVTPELIEEIKNDLPELPDAKMARYISNLELTPYDAQVLVAEPEVSHYFENAIKFGNPKIIANWVTTELFGYLNKYSIELKDCKISPSMLGEMVKLIEDKVISGKIAKTVFEKMFESGQSPQEIIDKYSLIQISDSESILPIIDEVLAENPNTVEEYRNGKEKLFGFFVGQIMKKTQGKANPAMLEALLKQKLTK